MSFQSTVAKVGYDSFYTIEHNWDSNNRSTKFTVPGVHSLSDKQVMRPELNRPEIKGPWRGVVMPGGERKEKLIFGQGNRQVWRDVCNGTMREWKEMTKNFYSNSGLKKLFLKNNVNDLIGVDDSMLDYKVMDLFDVDSDNCTIEYTLDLNLYDERKERIQSLMDDAGDFKVFRNPLGQVSYKYPVEISMHLDWMPAYLGEARTKAWCVNFAPMDCVTPDQLKKRYSQHGYVKFNGDKQILRKMGTRDWIIVSSPVWLDAQDGVARMKLKPGRPYELKTDSRVIGEAGAAHIIHIWKQV